MAIFSNIDIQVKISDRNVETKHLNVSYHRYGPPIGEAPIVLINHALTGNSEVSGSQGWFKSIIGQGKVIDTERYTVLAFNIPGNGYQSNTYFSYNTFTPKDIAQIFIEALKQLKIEGLHSVIGASVGGGIAWEMFALNPQLAPLWIPIASDWISRDWVKAITYLQHQTLQNEGLQAARANSMLYYRSPQSFDQKFNLQWDEKSQNYQVIDWLKYHGQALNNRYSEASYRLMNFLLGNIAASKTILSDLFASRNIQAQILQIGITSDLLFPLSCQEQISLSLNEMNISNELAIIDAPHGHDSFLMEHEQLQNILKLKY